MWQTFILNLGIVILGGIISGLLIPEIQKANLSFNIKSIITKEVFLALSMIIVLFAYCDLIQKDVISIPSLPTLTQADLFIPDLTS